MSDIVKKGQPQNPWARMRDLLAWDPFQEMSRYFPNEQQAPGGGFVPAFEVRETADGYLFKADLPGLAEGDLDINITGNRLTIGGKREAEQRHENDRFYAYEVSYGSFSRSFTLPDGIDADHVKADLKNGVLTLHVPKRAEAQPRRIQIGGIRTKA